MRNQFWYAASTLCGLLFFAGFFEHALWLAFVPLAPLLGIALIDSLQTAHTIRRNFPLFGNMRYVMEAIRPGINQYFVESNKEGLPFDRERRSIVYQRAKHQLDTLPFGTQTHVYQEGFEWINHSMRPIHPSAEVPRVTIGGPKVTQPYAAALLNVSAMSYGSLSQNAVLALNRGAKLGGFYHNTGEGGLSPYHLAHGGDLCWQIGTGYFGCRLPDGSFDSVLFAEKSRLPSVKMIEIKLSQGAKPGHGGILPASKLTPEIIAIRGVVPGKDVISPPAHSAFTTPRELLEFVARLRELSQGKPVGFKLCVGNPAEFIAVVKAMVELDETPDFITVDGTEGGTGAAPLEFSNSVGTPLKEGLSFVHNALVGAGVRDRIKIIAAGKVISGFDMVRHQALGADLHNAARAMMFALGCIQALKCHSNECPTGVATQNPNFTMGLNPANKALRVANYQKETVKSLLEVVGAAGLKGPDALRPKHIYRRVSRSEVKTYEMLFPSLKPRSLLEGASDPMWAELWAQANPEQFAA